MSPQSNSQETLINVRLMVREPPKNTNQEAVWDKTRSVIRVKETDQFTPAKEEGRQQVLNLDIEDGLENVDMSWKAIRF
jgi:hypothetical protein